MKQVYQNRNEAGTVLASLISNVVNGQTVLFAIPRGGVATAQPIATAFHLSIHLLMIKKISHPENDELAIGACGLTTHTLENKDVLTDIELSNTLRKLRENLMTRQSQFSVSSTIADVTGKTALLVDDGAATGLTLLCGIRELRRLNPRKIILAVPVASESAKHRLIPEVDQFICPIVSSFLGAVGEFYKDFSQVSDDDVRSMMSSRPNAIPTNS